MKLHHHVYSWLCTENLAFCLAVLLGFLDDSSPVVRASAVEALEGLHPRTFRCSCSWLAKGPMAAAGKGCWSQPKALPRLVCTQSKLKAGGIVTGWLAAFGSVDVLFAPGDGSKRGLHDARGKNCH